MEDEEEEEEEGMQNPILKILNLPCIPYKPKPFEFFNIIKNIFPFEKIEIIHEDLNNLKFSYNIVNNNQTKRIDFTFNKRIVYEFIIKVYKYFKNENDKTKKIKLYKLISLTLHLNILINTNLSTQMKKMNQMGKNQINWYDIIQIADDSKRDQITEVIEINKMLSIDGINENQLLNKLISFCEIYGQIFPTQNFQLSYNIFSISLNKKNYILYIINMLNGIITISELKTNIFIDLLNPKNNDNNNNILDKEFLLDLAKKNSPEYFIFLVKKYIREIEHGYQIFDSEYSKKKNKLNDLLKEFQSKYFNQLKQKEFNSNMEILSKMINNINYNENLKKSLLDLNSHYLNKFLIENNDEINIYKEKLKLNDIFIYINKIGDLIYKMQSLYISEINSKNFLDIRYEIIQLLIQLCFKINSVFYIYDYDEYYRKKIVLTTKRFRIVNNNIINFYELFENIKNCPKKIKDILNLLFCLYI